MRYKITIKSPNKNDIEKVHKLLENSKIYNSKETIISISSIKEVCDECAKKE